MRYSLRVRADRRDQVEAIVSKLPSHYVTAWIAATKEGMVQYSVPTRGAVKTLLPVGQLATLVPESTEEGVKPAWYQMSGEFNPEQLTRIKAAVKGTRLTTTVLKVVEGEDPFR